jgi:pimeloyl-ACP methyl ester carboxylesterase
MATYVLIHGAGDVGWYWHLVAAELEKKGHVVIAPDYPLDDESATLNDYAAAVISAVGDLREPAIVVAQSFGGFTAPIVASRIPTALLVFVAGMVPAPGESGSDMFGNTGYEQEPQDDPSDLAVFMHDVPRALAEEALSKSRNQASKGWEDPFPLDRMPDVPVRAVIGTIDRVFPPAWLEKVVVDRLGIVPDRIESGHCVALAKPVELAAMLERYREAL